MKERKNYYLQADMNRLYNHVLEVEGIRHPFSALDKLNGVADYIRNEFDKYGLSTSEQQFQLEGCDVVFRNIIGTLGNPKKPSLLITSHYDTMDGSPGADDNGSGIAVMLETARLLAKNNANLNVQFVCFTLEECNPLVIKLIKEKAQSLGLMNEFGQYLNYHTQKIMKFIETYAIKCLKEGKTISRTCDIIFSKIKKKLSKEEEEYVAFIHSFAKNQTIKTLIGTLANIGCFKYLKIVKKEKREILGVINLESVGYVSTESHSQVMSRLLPTIFPSYKIKIIKKVGNFIVIVGDKNSRQIAREFFKQCYRKEIDLPAVCLGVPLNLNHIMNRFRDLLRSDHVVFWIEGIPALMITDSCDYRNPYYHTSTDTIDKLDFDFIRKVCEATINTVINLTRKYNLK